MSPWHGVIQENSIIETKIRCIPNKAKESIMAHLYIESELEPCQVLELSINIPEEQIEVINGMALVIGDIPVGMPQSRKIKLKNKSKKDTIFRVLLLL